MTYYKHYKNWHKNTQESKLADIKESKEVIKLHNLLPNKNAKILELGCAMGRFMLALKDFGCNDITGVDITSEFVEIAQKEHLNVFQDDIINFLKKDKNLYDAIYCLDIIEHIDKDLQEELFIELYKHLTPKGFVAIKTINALSPVSSYFRYIDFTHKVSYTPETIKFLSENAGFENFIIRPEYQESEELQKIKTPIAEIYRKQFLMNDIILTPNIVAILFKNNDIATRYQANAPIIKNEYKLFTQEELTLKDLLHYYLNKIFLKISFGKINLYELKNYRYKFVIHKYKK